MIEINPRVPVNEQDIAPGKYIKLSSYKYASHNAYLYNYPPGSDRLRSPLTDRQIEAELAEQTLFHLLHNELPMNQAIETLFSMFNIIVIQNANNTKPEWANIFWALQQKVLEASVYQDAMRIKQVMYELDSYIKAGKSIHQLRRIRSLRFKSHKILPKLIR